HGFRIQLATESYYRRQSFGSSDAPLGVRPQLTVSFEDPDQEEIFEVACMKAEEEAELTFAGAQPYSREAHAMEIDEGVFEGELWSFRSGTGCADNAGTLCGTDY